jgi:hypothetical protein
VNRTVPCASVTVMVALRLLRGALPQLGVPWSCNLRGPAVTMVKVKYSMSVACLQQQQQQHQQQRPQQAYYGDLAGGRVVTGTHLHRFKADCSCKCCASWTVQVLGLHY